MESVVWLLLLETIAIQLEESVCAERLLNISFRCKQKSIVSIVTFGSWLLSGCADILLGNLFENVRPALGNLSMLYSGVRGFDYVTLVWGMEQALTQSLVQLSRDGKGKTFPRPQRFFRTQAVI